MLRVQKIECVDFEVVNDKVVRKGMLALFSLDRLDKRYMNIPAPIAEGELDGSFRDHCGVHLIYDCETKKFTISEKLVYMSHEYGAYIFAELFDWEKRIIAEELEQYGEEWLQEGEENSFLDNLDSKEFNEEYNQYFE